MMFDQNAIRRLCVPLRRMLEVRFALCIAHFMLLWCAAMLSGGVMITPKSFAGERTVDADYVLDMDLDDLMKAEVTSVSRYGKLHLDAPAAITVIDRAQIEKSGLREIPEILRLVPGMQVARTSANSWLISSRELPDLGSGKLLVLIDGRTIYSEDVGTTLWENQSITLEDVDRIEVIRGPGGTLWGYNAVNGVVNIITQSVRHTLGSLIDTGIADNGSTYAQVRHGLQLTPKTHMRFYYNRTDSDGFETTSGRSAVDELQRQRGGFRFEYEPSDASRVILDGEGAETTVGDGAFQQNAESTTDHSHIRLEWIRTFSRDFNLSLQIYYDREDYSGGETPAGKSFGTQVQNLDSEIQIDWRSHQRHRLMIGAGFRHSYFDVQSGFNPDISFGLRFGDESAEWQSYNVFVNDEIALVPGKFWLTLGTKLEHNEKTDWGWQPNARILYKPKPNQSLWASVSRVLKRPDFEDATPREELYGGPFIDFIRSEPLKDESLSAYEIGYRNQVRPDLSFDMAAYYNVHDNILLWDWQPISEFSYEAFNNYESTAVSYGAELSANWNPASRLNLMAAYAYFYTDYDVLDAWTDDRLEGARRHMVQLHVNYVPVSGVAAAVNTYYTSEATYDITRLPEHLRLDLVLRWQINDAVQLSLVGQNLLDDGHTEIDDTGEFAPLDPIEIPRAAYVSLKAVF